MVFLITSACEKDKTPDCSYPKNARLKRTVHCIEPNLDCPTMKCDGIIEREYIYNRDGKIKKVKIQPTYEEVVLKKLSEYELYDYDSEGKLVNIAFYSTVRVDGIDEYWHQTNRVFTYSDDGKVIREYTDWINSDWFQYTLFKYSNNRLSRTENYEINSDELENYILYEYEDSGNLVKETSYSKYDVLQYTTKHYYENGRNVETNKHGILMLKTYDENDNLILEETFYQSGSSKGNTRIKYEYFL